MTHEIMRAWAEAGIISVAEYVAWVGSLPTDSLEFSDDLWLAWREALREVVRGNATAIPDEPERYG